MDAPRQNDETKSEDESDDDLEQVAAGHRTLPKPDIRSVNQATKWIAKPAYEKTTSVTVSMWLYGAKTFDLGWLLTLIDHKRAAKFEQTRSMLESLPFPIRKYYLLSVTAYMVPFESKETIPIPDVPYRLGCILHFNHVTGLSRCRKTGIPRGNVSGIDRITEETVSVPAPAALSPSGVIDIPTQAKPSNPVAPATPADNDQAPQPAVVAKTAPKVASEGGIKAANPSTRSAPKRNAANTSTANEPPRRSLEQTNWPGDSLHITSNYHFNTYHIAPASLQPAPPYLLLT